MRVMTTAGEVVVGLVLMLGWAVLRLVEGRAGETVPAEPAAVGEQLRLPGISDPHEW